MNLDYLRSADRHRPTDTETLAREALSLAQIGLTARDVGAALGLAPAMVAGLLDTSKRGATAHE